jgi:CRISPR-associated protein Csb1
MSALDLEALSKAVAGGAAAIRDIARLEPAGGSGSKVFPPTHLKERNAQTGYAIEVRRVKGRDVPTILLDSIASHANRIEKIRARTFKRALGMIDMEVPFKKSQSLGSSHAKRAALADLVATATFIKAGRGRS